MSRRLAVLAVALGLMAASHGIAHADADYLNALQRLNGDQPVNPQVRTGLLYIGQVACGDLRRGMSIRDTAADLQALGIDGQDYALEVVTIASTTLCPT